jgi:hypothetical protein
VVPTMRRPRLSDSSGGSGRGHVTFDLDSTAAVGERGVAERAPPAVTTAGRGARARGGGGGGGGGAAGGSPPAASPTAAWVAPTRLRSAGSRDLLQLW